MTPKSKSEKTTGRMSGSVMEKKVRMGPAPSTSAASYKPSSMVCNPDKIRSMLKGIPTQRFATTTATIAVVELVSHKMGLSTRCNEVRK